MMDEEAWTPVDEDMIKELEEKRNDGGKFLEGYMKGQNDLVKSIREDTKDVYDMERIKTIVFILGFGVLFGLCIYGILVFG